MVVDNLPKILMAGQCLNGRGKLRFHFSWPAFLSIVLMRAPARSCFSLSTNKHILQLFAGFKTLETFQSTWHPFKLAAKKPSANRMGFREALSISAQSVCSLRHSLSWLIYFILKGLSICITRTGWKKKMSDVCDFFCLFKMIFLPLLRSPSPFSLTHPHLYFSLQVWYECCIPHAFKLEINFAKLWQTFHFFFYPSNISLLPSDSLATGSSLFQLK